MDTYCQFMKFTYQVVYIYIYKHNLKKENKIFVVYCARKF